jgi:hypothetical protein
MFDVALDRAKLSPEAPSPGYEALQLARAGDEFIFASRHLAGH